MSVTLRRHRSAEPYRGPFGPTPVSHVGYLESRHLHPERLPSRKKEPVVSLRLLDVSRETITNVTNVAPTVRRLVATNLSLLMVPDDLLSGLVHLTKLDISNNRLGDGSFPESMESLDQLLEVRLSSNCLTKVPRCIRKLRNLARLDLSNNQVDSPAGLEKLRKLQILVLDNNKLTSLIKEISGLKKLEILRCSGNRLHEVSRDIRHLKKLVDLDLSDNRITCLPTDIFLLPDLDVVDLSQNEISKVPTLRQRHQDNRCLSAIDLSDNKLLTCPTHLLLLTDRLDVSGNHIKVLPYSLVKKLDDSRNQDLLVDDNPLTYPPPEVCLSGLKNIVTYFQESRSEVKVYQGIKVHVVGHHQSGKTSLVQTLVEQQPRMSEDVQDSTAGLDTVSWGIELETLEDGRPGKALELNVWDFCGHAFYLYPHYIFLEQPAVTLLTFSVPEYRPDRFHELLGCWLDWMMAKSNQLVVVLVATQCDMADRQHVTEVMSDVQTRVLQHIEMKSDVIKSRIREIEDRPQISPTLSDQLQGYIRLLQAVKVTIYPEVVSTSARRYTGFDQLTQAILSLAGDRQLFPNVMRVIPTFWLDVQQYFEDKGNSMAWPVLRFETFQEEVTSRFGMKHLVKPIAQYLHDTGQILWFSHVETLRDLVFIRPSWLFDVFRSVLRHDFNTLSFSSLEVHSLTAARFERLKKEAWSDGVLDRDLARCILAPLVTSDPMNLTNDVMHLLTQHFQLGYSIIKKQSDSSTPNKKQPDSSYSLTPEREGPAPHLSKILMPWLRKNTEPGEFTAVWGSMGGKQRLEAVFLFPNYFPPGIFEVMCVRTHSDAHKLRFLHHWNTGVHALQVDEQVHVLISYSREHGQTWFKVEVRRDKAVSVEDDNTTTLWAVLLPLIMEMEELLGTYAGVLVERLMGCPSCRQATFLGEWLTPKETQGMTVSSCDTCGDDIDTAYLVQPREKKRDGPHMTHHFYRTQSSESDDSRANDHTFGADDD